MTSIRVEGLSKRYGTTTVLKDLRLSVPRGSIYGFLGPNGAGKTTTLRILTGLAKADEGHAIIEGMKVGQARPPIGFLPDTPSFYSWMKPLEFLSYIAKLHQLEQPDIEGALSRVGLKESRHKRIGTFSRGMKQRLGLAQALLPKPKVLLLDEPVSALDPVGRKDVLEIMAALRGEMTVFFSTHILSDAERICDWVGILNQGELVLEARREELLARYVTPTFEIDSIPSAQHQLKAQADKLAVLPWVERAEVSGTRLQLRVKDVERAQLELLSRLAGLPVTRVELVSATLEDVFLNLTGQTQGVRE